MLDADQAAELATTNPYHPARYMIRFEVPDGWGTLGILLLKKDRTG